MSQLHVDKFGVWRSCCEIMLIFGAVTGRLFWSLTHLQGNYFGLLRSYMEIMFAFGAITATLFLSLAQ